MDGVHDLGGLQGFGPVEVEVEEPVFHEAWERRAFRVNLATLIALHPSGGAWRHGIERMDPVHYLSSSYYEHWLTSASTLVVEAGLVHHEELDRRAGGHFPLSRPDRGTPPELPQPDRTEPRFRAGDGVRVREWHPLGHTRAPRYVQGKCGTVIRLDGVFSLPDVEYHCDRQRHEPTYCVRFEALEVWGSAGDPLHVDCWESYLESVDA
jgi:nitrile hydratase beta subunit